MLRNSVSNLSKCHPSIEKNGRCILLISGMLHVASVPILYKKITITPNDIGKSETSFLLHATLIRELLPIPPIHFLRMGCLSLPSGLCTFVCICGVKQKGTSRKVERTGTRSWMKSPVEDNI